MRAVLSHEPLTKRRRPPCEGSTAYCALAAVGEFEKAECRSGTSRVCREIDAATPAVLGAAAAFALSFFCCLGCCVFGMAGRLGWLRAAGEEETERLQGETEGMELEAGGVPRRRRGRR